MQDQLEDGRELVIHTSHSEYRFVVLDAEKRDGLLSGGSLGPQQHEAVLACALREQAGGTVSQEAELTIGSRAIFYMTTGEGLARSFTTSPVSAVGSVAPRRSPRDGTALEAPPTP